MSSAPKAVLPAVNAWNAEYLDAQYQQWLNSPTSVPDDLRSFFQGFDLARNGHAPSAVTSGASRAPSAPSDNAQAAVVNLMQHYRDLGHHAAAIDPFGREREAPAELNPLHVGLTAADMDREFSTGDAAGPDAPPLPLRRIVEIMEETYCGSIGVEIAHVTNRTEWEWLVRRIESTRNKPQLTKPQRVHILFQLHRAELFEKFCAKKYVGVKRFSLEGGESLIPMLDRFIEHAGDAWNTEEIVFAMAHRGRLNVLTNIIGKTYEQIFTEFEDAWKPDAALGGGDVKYHRGYSAARLLPSGKSVWLCMCSNPSHLESVGPVALGRCRAKQRMGGDSERTRCIPLLIHGDAALPGQGIVAESLNFSQLDGYTVGGTVHVVINNLIGFTTGEEDARSTKYCTDIAKSIEAPVFHVNGEDPEAVVHAITLALDYRMAFKKDVFVDLVCYRRHGHNETDEAAFTQPILYKAIHGKPSVLKTYAERLLAEGVISEQDMEGLRKSIDQPMDKAWSAVKAAPVDPTPDPGHRRWEGQKGEWTFEPVETGASREALLEVSHALGQWPEGFAPHPKLVKTLHERARCVQDDLPIDWGTAEALAFGTLLCEGTLVRLSGQDVRRGTFSHRHAALRDVNTSQLYIPLNNIREMGKPGTPEDVGTLIAGGPQKGKKRQAKLCIYDSPLSEFSVMGFEYGFSLASPNMLVLWEAQFGDFCNGAQTTIDQYLAAGEIKWQRWCGLVLLLPHGYEGQGPEHSSCRMERFLQLCADDNMQVCNCSTPAQYFHVLRRQLRRNFRKPLIIATPKSLLRAPFAASRASELVEGAGGFHEVIDDPIFPSKNEKKRVKRILMCSGKVYYDLVTRRTETGRDDLAIVRVEQLYPFHAEMIERIIASYPSDAEVVWVQEEPQNAGAWSYMLVQFRENFGRDLPYIGRRASSTPATGSPRRHKEELDEFLTDAVGALSAEKRAAALAGAH